MSENRESWEEKYMQTVQEVSAEKMPERIAATRQAIAERLRDLEQSNDHHVERQEIEKALKALSMLEEEVKEW